MNLARFALDEGRPDQAEALASQAAQQFSKDRSSADEAFARIVIARSYLAQHKIAQAEAALSSAGTLTRNNPSRSLRFELEIASAYENASASSRADRGSVRGIEKRLGSSLTDAMKCGYLEYEFRIRLALGEIELKHGSADAGRVILQALSKDARAKGFGSVARSAEVALGRTTIAHQLPPTN